jgi:hypothetical protein
MQGHPAKVVVACAAAFLLFGGSASAAAPYTSKVTLSKYSPTWHGKVMSTRFGGVRSCERKRTVKVYERRNGKDRLVGTDESSRSGRWVVPDKPTKGTFYAKLTERGPGAKPACRGDVSSFQTVG